MVQIYPNQICVKKRSITQTKEGGTNQKLMWCWSFYTRGNHTHWTRGHQINNRTFLFSYSYTLYDFVILSTTKRSETMFIPDCLKLSVNVEKVREVFVTECWVNKLTVTGDTKIVSISIKDSNGQNCGS